MVVDLVVVAVVVTSEWRVERSTETETDHGLVGGGGPGGWWWLRRPGVVHWWWTGFQARGKDRV